MHCTMAESNSLVLLISVHVRNCRTGSILLAMPTAILLFIRLFHSVHATMIVLARIVTKDKRDTCFISSATTSESRLTRVTVLECCPSTYKHKCSYSTLALSLV